MQVVLCFILAARPPRQLQHLDVHPDAELLHLPHALQIVFVLLTPSIDPGLLQLKHPHRVAPNAAPLANCHEDEPGVVASQLFVDVGVESRLYVVSEFLDGLGYVVDIVNFFTSTRMFRSLMRRSGRHLTRTPSSSPKMLDSLIPSPVSRSRAVGCASTLSRMAITMS